LDAHHRISWRRLIILLPLLFSVLACQAAFQALNGPTPTPIPSDTPSPTPNPPTATSTQTPTETPTSTPLPPTATVTLTPTQTLIPPTATITPTSLPLDLQLSVFQDLWETVRDNYLYPDFNGLDWDEIHDEYENKIRDGLSNAAYYDALDEMIQRLGDEHSIFLSPRSVYEDEQEYAGNYDYVGVGILLSAVPARDRAVILAVFSDSPAEKSGIKVRDSILSAEGIPILDERGSIRSTIRGPEGSEVTIVVQTPGEAPREVTLVRQHITSSLPVPHTVITTPDGLRIGYILIVTFADSTIDESVADALRDLTAQGPLDGLIIDNRPNGGGADTVVRPILSYFTSGTLGNFTSRDGDRPFVIHKSVNINGSQETPLVVLVGLDTVSFGEIFSGILQDIGRAFIIGETTGGNVETLWGFDYEDGSRVWLARESFHPINNPEADWEQTGIVPDLEIPANWDEYNLDTDPAVQAAIRYFSDGE
jgi:C-terminal peptidase prc